ncbi:hypothetical protein ASA1KI_17080 [Opitutales bacterium ASA1]|uniref:TonB-dependent receptor domain-containing protein n=1 Tax=Congregicoccus parvus TaxID=3081749 RepID=UPI002B30CA4D|nr:hypothetical protein ASA1KI_17080 [Opitutales bacterium ASA1]
MSPTFPRRLSSPSVSWRTGATALCLAWMSAYAFGQAVPPSSNTPPAEPVVELSTFEVASDSDTSYEALNSASITRFNVEMKDMPVSADIFTQTLMRDVAASSIEDVVQGYSAGAGYAAADGSGGDAAGAQPGDRNANTYIQIRGMNTPVIQRDSFMPVGTFGNPGSTGVGRTDNFDLERVELINGPQALLYGGGGAGGVINVTSKQARFGTPGSLLSNPRGYVLFRTDDFGTLRGEVDLGAGNDWFGVRVALLAEEAKTRRVNIGGETMGQYLQLAFRLFPGTVPTTVRVSGSFTQTERWLPRVITLNAPGDTRHNHRLRYLLATGQAGATNPVTGAPYLRGAILDGNLNWDNVDSFAAGKMQQDPVDNAYGSMTMETKWSSWLTTQAAVGYTDYEEKRGNPGFDFYAPFSGANPTDEWAGSINGPQYSHQPAITKGGRFAALLTHAFLDGRAQSQTLLGIDYVKTRFLQNQYRFYLADADWNIVYAPGSTITSPNSGRTVLGRVNWPLTDGPNMNPFPTFDMTADRGVINGNNYVLALVNTPDPSLVTPENPLGVPFSSGNFIRTEVSNRGIYGVNYTQWFDGKFSSLVGLRQGDYRSLRLNHPDGNRTTWLADTSVLNFNVGLTYDVNNWFRPFVNYSDSVSLPYVANRADPHNNEPQSSRGIGGEVGIKIVNTSGSLSGSIAVFRTKSENDLYAIDGSIRNAINPPGLNNVGGGGHVSIDRVTEGVELRLTAAPTRNWRMRFSFATNDGEIGTTRAYEQFYNDQFYANAAGQVTYRNGTVVYVNGDATTSAQAGVVSATAPGAVPLTIERMSTPGADNFYFADPDETNGHINTASIVAGIIRGTNSAAAAAIQANGPILTGAVNLPISELQLDRTLAGIETPGVVLATRIGDKTTGYPEYSANLTTHYAFTRDNWMKGFGVGGSVLLSWKNRSYYYYATPLNASNALTLQRTLFYQPNLRQVNLTVSYQRKFGRYEWLSQLNVNNVFDRYKEVFMPNGTTGFRATNNINVSWFQQPRSFIWTNTLRF